MARKGFTRRQVLKAAAAAAPAAYAAKALGACADTTPVSILTADNTGCPIDADRFPTSPLILNPFVDPLPVPLAFRPGYRNPDGTLATAQTWNVRQKNGVFGNFTSAPGPGVGQQDSIGDRPMFNDGKTFTFFNPKTGALTTKTLNFGGAHKGTHQLYPGGFGVGYPRLPANQTVLPDGTITHPKAAFDLLNPNPMMYHLRLMVRTHAFTSSPVVSINSSGQVVPLPAGAAPTAAGNIKLPAGFNTAAGTTVPTYFLPQSTIYGFNGQFPGPMINLAYGQPIIVRYENDLDFNPLCVTRQDFGAPDWAFLTHLHNGHTAPEGDGQPNDTQDNDGGYQPAQWVDSLYLGYGAGGDDAEKQSFLWFHDHRMHHTGPNVYKGMVGLIPHYDPATPFNPTGIDSGDETTGLRLPGVRTNNPDGTFDVKFDIPLVFYDFIADDGVVTHSDTHQPITPQPWSNNVCGQTHPEWWGMLFHQHYPNHGFVGDIFTVNGTAFPVLTVERRHYRFRFLDASVSRQYELSLRSNQGTNAKLTPLAGTFNNPVQGQGQWGFQDNKGKWVIPPQVMKMTQIASGGGLMPNPVLMDKIQVWPAKRREVVCDFSVYQDGSPTHAGDVIYLVNTAVMTDGRKQNGNLVIGGAFAVPLVKFIIGSNVLAVDNSDPGLSPVPAGVKNQVKGNSVFNPNKVLRTRHVPPGINDGTFPEDMDFTLQRGGAGGEAEWLINGLQFDPLNPLWAPTQNAFETWGINNGGGGWTHPMHMHYEEHQVTFRTTGLGPNAQIPHPEDPLGKEDLVSLEPSEQSHIYRCFRTFTGNYVAHCHNLAHEDHNMMFGWSVTL